MDDVVDLRNMENVCRLCLSAEEPKLSIFGSQDSATSVASTATATVPLVNKIQACLSLQILSTDKLSTLICAPCVTNVNQWYSYKEACLQSQDKLQRWLTLQTQNTYPTVLNIKEEPIDLEYCENNVEVLLETNDRSLHKPSEIPNGVTNEVTNDATNEATIEASNDAQCRTTIEQEEDVPIQKNTEPQTSKTLERQDSREEEQIQRITIKGEVEDDYDTDCTTEIEPVADNELLLNPMAITGKENRVTETDSSKKSNTTSSTASGKKKMKRGPHTHFRGTRVYKQKCRHCQINLHSKYSYVKHMQRFHTDDSETRELSKSGIFADEEELIEDVEDELISMEKDAPLTEVQQNIISQLKTFSCYSCRENFSDRRSTLSHIRQHMPDLRPYTCIACLTEFPDRSMYKLHCSASFECAMKIALVIPKEGSEKYFTCNMCLRPMQNRKELLSHLSKHSNKQYEELTTPARSPTRSPPKLQPMAPLPAPLSTPKAEPSKPNVIRSTRLVLGPYKNGDPAHNHVCELCGMIYRYKPNLLKHRTLCMKLPEEARTCYKCIYCGMTFLVFKKFQNHTTVEHKKKEFACFDCNAKFKTSSDYLAHYEMHRATKNRSQAQEDTKFAAKPVLEKYTSPKWSTADKIAYERRKKEDQKKNVCALCGQRFLTKAELTEHRNLHLKVKIYSCVICRSMFSSAGALQIHMKDHGIEDPQERNANSSCIEYARNTNDNLKTNSTPQTTKKAGTTFSTPLSAMRKNECQLCGKVFSSYLNLRKHCRYIHEEQQSKYAAKGLRCRKCSKTFSRRSNLNLHYQSVHGNKPVGEQACDICGKVFLEEASLKIHRGWHNRANSRLNSQFYTNGEKKVRPTLSCPANMATEKKLASGGASERPPTARKSFPAAKSQGSLQCQVCDDRFSDVTELRRHLWDVHCARNKPEKNFSGNELQCQLCTNVMPDEKSLQVHMEWHQAHPILSDVQRQSFPCEICGKQYSSKKVLNRHKKLHKTTAAASMKLQSLAKKSAQLVCTVCRKTFSSNQSLQRHKLTFHSDLQKSQQEAQASENNSQSPVRSTPTDNEEPKAKRIKMEVDEDLKLSFALMKAAGKKPVTCHLCKQFFPNMKFLYRHRQLVHKLPRSCRIEETNASDQSDGEKGYVVCYFCGKQFSSMPNMRLHCAMKHDNNSDMSWNSIAMPNKSKLLCCNLCKRHVWSKMEMSEHMRSVHKVLYLVSDDYLHKEIELSTYNVEGAVNATCPRCNIKYPNNRAMKIHYFKFHEEST